MTLFSIIKKRRSIRLYKDAPVLWENMVQVLDAGRFSPSWKNGQCCSYIVVKDKQIKAKIASLVNNNPHATAYLNAPYLIVQCADPALSGYHNSQDYYLVDAGMAFENMALMATFLGLGMCCIGIFDEAGVKEILNIPENIRVVALSPLGVPDQDPKAKPRNSLSKILYSDTWGNALEHILPK